MKDERTGVAAWMAKPIEEVRWRKFDRQPEGYTDWPANTAGDIEGPRFLVSYGDPILCYSNCNGYDLWRSPFDAPPPAEWWIAPEKRPA